MTRPSISRFLRSTLIVPILLLAACAPRTSLIAASVSGTLTALAPTAILPAGRPTSTAVPTLAPLPSPTAPPASPVPDTATAVHSPAAGTSASDPSTTPAATDAATAAPTDASTAAPASTTALGDVIFQDTFDSPGLWTVGETDASSVSIAGGVMTFTQKTPASFSVRIIGRKGSDFYAEVTGALADRCQSGDRYGLIFRAQDLSNFYALQVDCDGNYRLARYSGGAPVALIDWTPSNAIQRGRGSANTLAMTVHGAAFQVIINGTALGTASDSSFADGRFGLMVGANISRNFAVIFDNLKVNKLP